MKSSAGKAWTRSSSFASFATERAPEAFDEEIERAYLLLLDRPNVGQAIRTKRRGGARRIYLERIRYYMYYEAKDAIFILTLWHASRRPPRL